MNQHLRSTYSHFLILLVLVFCQTINAQQVVINPDPKYKLLAGKSFVQSKNYYLLTLLDELPEVQKLLVQDSILSKLAINKWANLTTALKSCNRDASCFTNAFKFSQEEINTIGSRLVQLYQPENALGKLVSLHLMPSGCYALFQGLTPKEILQKAWEQDAMGVNFSIGVYAEGQKPNYPLIDSVSFNTHDARYAGLLYNCAYLLQKQEAGKKAFYQIPFNASLLFLELNEREQAADFEPMTATENKAAFDKVKTINWNSFPYSVISVPGAGPDIPTIALSAEGMIRCRLAAVQYTKGLAPFIIVSGGKVHPYKTKFCEALEMKHYLVNQLHIPASAIIIDPHARHTTTNMRNTARLIFRYGMPFSKPGISCTTRGQSSMIAVTLLERCIKELKLAPYKNGNRLSETEMEFYPLIEALHINPTEPIDP